MTYKVFDIFICSKNRKKCGIKNPVGRPKSTKKFFPTTDEKLQFTLDHDYEYTDIEYLDSEFDVENCEIEKKNEEESEWEEKQRVIILENILIRSADDQSLGDKIEVEQDVEVMETKNQESEKVESEESKKIEVPSPPESSEHEERNFDLSEILCTPELLKGGWKYFCTILTVGYSALGGIYLPEQKVWK